MLMNVDDINFRNAWLRRFLKEESSVSSVSGKLDMQASFWSTESFDLNQLHCLFDTWQVDAPFHLCLWTYALPALKCKSLLTVSQHVGLDPDSHDALFNWRMQRMELDGGRWFAAVAPWRKQPKRIQIKPFSFKGCRELCQWMKPSVTSLGADF